MKSPSSSLPITGPGITYEEPIAPAVRWSRARLSLRDPRVWVALPVAAAFVLMAIFAPILAGQDPSALDLAGRLKAPGWFGSAHFLGTDQVGRDLWAQVVYGSRVSLAVSGIAAALSALVGISLGTLAGYRAGALDQVITFLTEVQLSVPYLLVALTLLTVVPPGIPTLILVLALSGWPTHTRMIRARVLALKHAEFVEAARAAGVSPWRILYRHLLPNALSVVIVILTLQIAQFIIAEATLSFLGLGVPPNVPSWGSMVSQGQNYIWQQWWVITFPGCAIVLAVLAFAILGDWLRDRLDPKLRI